MSSTENKPHVSTSEILKEFIKEEKQGSIALKDFIARLGDRGFGLITLIFALPNTVPLGIPGVSSICAVPIMFVAIQMMLGRHILWLPKFVEQKQFPEEKFDTVLQKSIPMVRWMERFIRPRLHWMTVGTPEKFVGFILFILAAIIFLPIPGGNFIPAICMTMLSLGLMNRDGWMVIAGIIAGIVTTVGMSYVIIAFFEQMAIWAHELF